MAALQEQLFCDMTEQAYDAIVNAIKTALNVPIAFLESIKSAIRKIEMIILETIAAAVKTIEERLFDYLDSKGIVTDTSKQAANLCALLYACSALRESLIDPNDSSGDSDALFVKFMPVSVRNQIRGGNYDAWETNICKLSLRRLIDEFLNSMYLLLAEELAALREQLIDALNIDALIDAYEELLRTDIPGIGKNIFELMDELDKFAQCAFGVCNFINSSANQKEEFSKKAYIQKEGGDWIVNLKELTQDMDDTGNILLDKIDALYAYTQDPGSKDKGISSDEVMKS